METKVCTKCRVTKVISDFQLRNDKPISQCRTCVNAIKADYKRRKRAEVRQYQIESGEIRVPTDPLNNIICNQCRIEKPKTSFRVGRCKCIDCERAYGRAYRQSEAGKKKSAQWIENNPGRMTELQARWYQENKEKRNEEYIQRYHSDPVFRFKVLCKSRIHHALRAKGLQKSDKTVKYLNCSISWLVQWFQFCFSPEMTLENQGTYWHMDHVIPINLWDLTDPIHVLHCFSWYNLSPLPGNENMAKHDTIDTEQIQRHVQKLVDFLYLWNVHLPHDYFDFCARHLRIAGKPLELYLPLGQ